MISFMQNAGLGCKEDDKKNGYNCDFDPVSKVTSTKLADQPSTGEAANVIKFHNEGKLVAPFRDAEGISMSFAYNNCSSQLC